VKPSVAGRSALIRYGGAVAVVALAYVSRAALNHFVGTVYPFATFFIAALLCGLLLGPGPGITSVVLGAVVAQYLIIGPGWRFLPRGGNPIGLVLYVGNSTALIVLFHRLRVSRSRLETQILQLTKARAEAVELTSLLDLAQDAILSLSLTGVVEFWNKGAEQMYGWRAAEALGRISHEILQTEFPQPRRDIERALLERGAWQGDLVHTTKNGHKVVVLSRWALKRGRDGTPAGFLEIDRDITERKQIEEKLRETARMESLGLLAGGIAHDFNNLLVGVIGNASLVMERLHARSTERSLLQELIRSAERMAYLTRQLLAYVGKGRFLVRRVNLSEIIREAGTLLESTIPKNVRLEFALSPVPLVEADVTQMQQAIANLVINAAEAIGEAPGTVSVETGIAEIDESYRAARLSDFPILPGRFVAVRVQDNGCGMDAATQSRIFDPFFTTKFLGRGLGLSAVVGIVRGHRGALAVTSAPGQGSTFELFFPVAEAAAARPSGASSG
jgi:PAS domain S-box-containing protein